jgi:aldehyde:ferredoxin oxidoreductase
MACKKNATCDFCDIRCADWIIDKDIWIEICQHYDKWCSFKEVEGLNFTAANNYIKNLSVFVLQ